VQHEKNNIVKGSISTVVNKNGANCDSKGSKKYAYNNNYKGKNPMIRTQWRKFQRSKKRVVASFEGETVDPKGKQEMVKPLRRPMEERLYLPPVEENPNEDDELDSEFMDSDPDFSVICNVASILPAEYDMVSEVDDSEEDFDPKDMEKYQPMCYYVMDDGCESEQKAIFEKPDSSMKNHLKPLFIQAKVDEIGIYEVLVDGGAVNLMP